MIAVISFVCGMVLGFYLLAKIIYGCALLFSKNETSPKPTKGISILVAARDEEKNLLTTLESLASMEMQGVDWEVWIGDDRSSDRTASIALEFCSRNDHFHYCRIENDIEGIKAKQNVLAQLVTKCIFENILICDADMRVKPQWAKTLAGELEKGFGMICGPTVVEGPSFFAKLQSLDWLMGMAIAKSHDVLGIPITGVGNNMAVNRQAYQEVGGYEKLPFSITEDYKLFQAIHEKAGWKYRDRKSVV